VSDPGQQWAIIQGDAREVLAGMTFGSLFAGIGGLDLGLERAGMLCKWQGEIDGYCLKVLEKHWPNVRRYGDVRECGRQNLEPVDLICGGFPCQDVSVAGRRKGLAGSRSGLWFEFHRVLEELRPRWVVIENVPGLLSSRQGRDFALILRGLAELGYLSAWRILDAQYFGVAQRRRRVFIVGHLGDGRAAQVLFEPTCGPRDTPPSREAGARVADPLTESFAKHRGASAGKDSYPRNMIVEETLAWHENKAGELTPSDHMKALRSGASHSYQGVAYNIQQNDGGEHRRKDRPEGGMYVKETDKALTVGTTDRTVVASTLVSPQKQWNSEQALPNLVVGFDKSRGTVSGDVSAPLRCNSAESPGVNDGKADNQCVLYRDPDHYGLAINAEDSVSPPLVGGQSGGGGTNNRPHVLAVSENQRAELRLTPYSRQLTSGGGKPGQGYPAVLTVGTLSASDGEWSYLTNQAVDAGYMQLTQYGVRRLTPVECERLQGFPDNFTAGQSDSKRYKQLGNAVCVPVAEWIGRRIMLNIPGEATEEGNGQCQT